MNRQIIELVERHCDTLRVEFAAVEDAFAELGRGAETGALDRLVAATHKIKGSSGTLGFAEISARAARYEHALRDAVAAAPFGSDPHAFRALHDGLARAVAEIHPAQSTLHARFSQTGTG
ncbi:Hpt domain-containing protein [Jannaschia ovalis]|uniref:Hpt domain-containing protein n=1 Tax=Jannaschia ovalis TaxID=3038773 RepID=A0ABY8LAX7_9RHOB|nr:Hpt domain-containing protein [Jannaschia sp. GRR-S6-38]WGH78439.1 Hpt domain-containing protein [Jannaschia sp. GRR-S6-38]